MDKKIKDKALDLNSASSKQEGVKEEMADILTSDK